MYTMIEQGVFFPGRDYVRIPLAGFVHKVLVKFLVKLAQEKSVVW